MLENTTQKNFNKKKPKEINGKVNDIDQPNTMQYMRAFPVVSVLSEFSQIVALIGIFATCKYMYYFIKKNL